MEELFTYGPGIPRYLALWLPLTPVMVAGLRWAGVRWSMIAVVVATTLPTFGLHIPSTPGWPQLARYALFVGGELVLLAWLIRLAAARGPGELADELPGGRTGDRAAGDAFPAVAAITLVALGLLLRIPLAWVDPGIGDFARASETAAAELLRGVNPYTVANPHTTFGTYQYPAGTLLFHVPFVAALPASVLGEAWFAARAAVWAAEAVAIVLLVWAGTRIAGPRAGTIAGFAYAVHPTIVRESGIVVANDLLLAVLVTAAAYAAVRRHPAVVGVLVGLAIAVKPAAAVLLPLVLVAHGGASAGWALAVPALLQAPFLLWPRPGLHGIRAILEPAARDDPFGVLRSSTFWPWYAATDGRLWSVSAAAAVGLAAALAAAWWVGRRLREDRDPALVLAAYALPLTVAFLLASIQRTNYGDWALPTVLLAVGVLTVSEISPRRPQARSTPRPRR